MLFLRKIHSFGATQSDTVHLWVVYCRSLLEQSAGLWQGGLTQENREKLERTQKSFVKLVSKGNTAIYETLLSQLNFTTLDKRRDLTFLDMGQKNVCPMKKLQKRFHSTVKNR